MKKFMKENIFVGIIVTLIRVYYGWSWTKAAWGKITAIGTENAFNPAGFFNYVVLNPEGAIAKKALGGDVIAKLWMWITETLFVPMSKLLAYVMPFTELIVGILLILGLFTVVVAWIGIILNTTFLLSGVVYPNVHYIAGQFIAAICKNPYHIKLDNYVDVKKYFKKNTISNTN